MPFTLLGKNCVPQITTHSYAYVWLPHLGLNQTDRTPQNAMVSDKSSVWPSPNIPYKLHTNLSKLKTIEISRDDQASTRLAYIVSLLSLTALI